MGIINLNMNGQIQFWRGGGGGDVWVDVPVPDAAFNFVPFTIQQKVGTRTFRPKPGWDIKDHVDMTGGDRYVKKGGDNGAAGTSWATAWATIRYALQNAPDNGVIYVDSGIYGWADGGPQNYAWPGNRSLIGAANDVIIDSYVTPSWSKTGGQTNVYQTAWAYGTAGGVLDYSVIGLDGFPQSYIKKTSVGDVDSNEGSWYWASNVLYVHAVGHGSPSSSVRPQRREGYACNIAADNRKGYLENLRIYSTRIAAANASATGGTEMYVKDCILMAKGCDFTYMAAHVGNVGANVILQDCEILGGVDAYRGIEYGVANGVTGYLALIDCHIHDIGDPAVAITSYCFRSLANTKLLVVGGEYDHVLNTTMYIHSSTYAWILGANVHHGNVNFNIYSTACYLDNVTGTDYTTQQFVMISAVAVYLRNFVGGFKGGDVNKMTGYDY